MRSTCASVVLLIAACNDPTPTSPAPDMALVASSCSDGLRNGNESDVDCGGSCGATCAISQTCNSASDCASLHCSSGHCAGPRLSFAPPVTYQTGHNPIALVAGDLDGDLAPDLLVANYDDQNVTVLRNDRSGRFHTWATVATGAQPWALALGDLDGDNNLDAVVGRNAPALDVLMGRGDATFSPKSELGMDTMTRQPVIALLDADPIPVIFVPAGSPTTKRIHRVTRAKDGTLLDAAAFGDGLSDPDGLAAGDIDGDGLTDLAVADVNGDVAVFHRDGHGSFQQTNLAGGYGPNIVRIADLGHPSDGRGDIIFTNWNATADRAVIAVVDIAAPTPPPLRAYPVGTHPEGLAVADFDGDGILDIAVDGLDDQAVTVYLGVGDGTFVTPGYRFEGGVQPTDLVAADLDGNGLTDLAFCNHDIGDWVTVLLNTSSR